MRASRVCSFLLSVLRHDHAQLIAEPGLLSSDCRLQQGEAPVLAADGASTRRQTSRMTARERAARVAAAERRRHSRRVRAACAAERWGGLALRLAAWAVGEARSTPARWRAEARAAEAARAVARARVAKAARLAARRAARAAHTRMVGEVEVLARWISGRTQRRRARGTRGRSGGAAERGAR